MILCCGEALIDMIPAPTTVGRDGFVPHSGGAVFNTAIGLGRLGADVALFTGISTDQFGDQLMTDLGASQVSTGYVHRADRPSTLAFVHLTDGHARYSFFDENTAGRMLSLEELPTLSSEITALFFGGISLVCEPGADSYLALAERAHADRIVMVDPNIRPSFIQDADRYRKRLDRLLACADIVKVSDEDLDYLVPGTGDLESKAAVLQELGPSIVVVTLGAKGAFARLATGATVEVESSKADVVDTVGAGDSFNAGVLHALTQQGVSSKAQVATISPNAVEEALRFAAKVAAVTVSRAGANPPWQAELDGF